MTLVTPDQVNPGDEITADKQNTPINQLADVINGNIDDTNISSVSGAKLSTGTVSTAKLEDGAVTNAKLDTTAGAPGGAWASWTPTYSGLTVGNGTVTAKYTQIGKTVHFHYEIVLGSTSAVTGNLDITLPVTSVSYQQFASRIGLVAFFDTSASSIYGGHLAWLSTTQMRVYAQTANNTYEQVAGMSSTVPFTWASGDIIGITGSYEAA